MQEQARFPHLQICLALCQAEQQLQLLEPPPFFSHALHNRAHEQHRIQKASQQLVNRKQRHPWDAAESILCLQAEPMRHQRHFDLAQNWLALQTAELDPYSQVCRNSSLQ